MIKTYNNEQHEIFRAGGKILSDTFEMLKDKIKPGISTLELDKIADDFIMSKGATPSFKNYRGYEHATCMSVNECIIHGVPKAETILKDGDVVSIDIGVRYGGLCTDAARTFAVGNACLAVRELINVTERAFWAAFEHLRAGIKPKEIGAIIEKFIRKTKKFEIIGGLETYDIVDNFFGHGIGEELHQEPLIPNFKPRKRELINRTSDPIPAGCVICIEPMITQGQNKNKILPDRWTVVTMDGKLSAHYENTVIIHQNHAEVIT